MTRMLLVAVWCTVTLTPSTAWSADALERFALVVGANSGGAGRPQLKYAVSDAERFARVMVELGGVTPGNELVLRQPKLHELTGAFDTLARRVADGRRAGHRTELVVYYSGHADESGLLLGDDRYSYRTLRDRLDGIPADVRIAVLDACSSGAFTRLKSGRPRPPFLVDESSDMRGHAFLTSSSDTEAAQESDRIRASYFTHYLVSGLRGAADLSGDGKVTLNEAYQFAFNETLGRTVDSKGGAQHPSYDISMSGTGDVVMTDVRQTTATLVLAEALEGRFFVRNAARELIVELYKPRGRRVELAVEAGGYEIRLEREHESLVAHTDITDGSRVVVDPRQFGQAAAPEPTVRRGDTPTPPEPPRLAVAGRHRLDFTTGIWNASAGSYSGTAGLRYQYYVNENFAMTFDLAGVAILSGSEVSARGISSGNIAGMQTLVGTRWNPWPGDHRHQVVKPFVAGSLGLFTGVSSGSFIGSGSITSGDFVRNAFGAHIGGGFDVHVARSIALGFDVGYNAMGDFSSAVGPYRNFNGTQVGFSFGWLIGKGHE
jgi:hypothetical protein